MRLRDVSLVLALLLAAFALAQARQLTNHSAGLDFYQFWAVGQALRTMPVHNIYSDADRQLIGAEMGRRVVGYRHEAVARFRSVLQTYSSPLLYGVLGAFGFSYYEFAYQSFQIFSLLCVFGAALLLCRILRYPWPQALLATAVVVGFFKPVLEDTGVGNVNRMQLAGLALFCWFVAREEKPIRSFAAGLTIGLLVLFKPNTLYVAVAWAWWWLAGRQFRRLAWMIGGGVAAAAVAAAITFLCFGSLRCWLDWVVALRAIPDQIIPITSGNFALLQFIRHATGVNLGVGLTVFFVAPVLALTWRIRRAANSAHGAASWLAVTVVGLGSLIYLLSAKLAWEHYFTAAIPLLLVGLRPRLDADAPAWSRAATSEATLTAVALVLLCALSPLQVTNNYWIGAMVAGGTVLLYFLAASNLWRAARDDIQIGD